jgi:hypothetical protein
MYFAFLSRPILSLSPKTLKAVETNTRNRWTGQDVDVYKMPGTMGIAHNNDGTVPDVITLNIVNNDDEDDAGLCEILTGIGNGLAGSINGAAGGIFQLGSVACKAI